MIQIALNYHHFELAEYLKTNLEQIPTSFAENLYFGNYDIASDLRCNGADINKFYIHYCIIKSSILFWNSVSFYYVRFEFKFYIDLFSSISFDINHYFMIFSCLSWNPLYFNYILFIFISFINFCNSFSIPIIQWFVTLSKCSNLSYFKRILFHFTLSILLWNYFEINESPLTIAIRQESLGIVKYLVDHGANVNLRHILFLFISPNELFTSISLNIYHYVILFESISYKSLFNRLLFRFISIIPLDNSL